MEINEHEAREHFSELIDRVVLSEEVTIMRAGKPVARLVPIEKLAKRRQLGLAKGQFVVPEDFDAPLPPDVEESFYR